jgi:ABC-type nitrate/sulfonate/bicarbonate transport system substrate-binding protein
MIRENPNIVWRMVRAVAEAIHYYKNKDPVVKIMQKYSRGPSRAFFEAAYEANVGALVDSSYPNIEGLRNTLDIQAALHPKAGNAKVEDFVDLRFVDKLRKAAFLKTSTANANSHTRPKPSETRNLAQTIANS